MVDDPEVDYAIRVVTEHSRSRGVPASRTGVVPANEGQGVPVLRRDNPPRDLLLRYSPRKLGIDEAFHEADSRERD